MKRLVIDLDGTLTAGETSDYDGIGVNEAVAAQLRAYHADGFEIVLYTARNMRTHQSSLGRITAKTVPGIVDWLARHEIPYDELWVGKPWCGTEGFYVDDKAVRPDEFARLSYDEIRALLGIGGGAP
jgi:capsule biosynthesis phosphatase